MGWESGKTLDVTWGRGTDVPVNTECDLSESSFDILVDTRIKLVRKKLVKILSMIYLLFAVFSDSVLNTVRRYD